jgi:Reverse transcriptase (RNA-dependent DNA polymerase)
MSFLVLLAFFKGLYSEKLMLQFGFTSSAIPMIKSYLVDWAQYVLVDGTASTFLPVTSGVVQGSILGLLLSSLFIGDICSQITVFNFHIYADDVQVYTSSRPGDMVRCIDDLNAN